MNTKGVLEKKINTQIFYLEKENIIIYMINNTKE